MIECPNCEKTSSGSSCRLCGWTAAPAPKVQETHAPAKLPAFREPTPEEDAEIRKQRAELHAASWWRDTQGTAPLPTVDPTIRAKVDGKPVPVGELVKAKMDELKGAPR